MKGTAAYGLGMPQAWLWEPGTFRACSKCRRREEESGASDCSELRGDGMSYPLRAGAAGGQP